MATKTKKTTTPSEYTTVEEWKTAFAKAFKRKMKSGKDFNSEDIRLQMGMPPGVHPNTFGSVWRALLSEYKDQLLIVGLKRSAIKSAKGRAILIYRGN